MEIRGKKVPCHRVDVGECPEGHHLMCRSYRRGFTVASQLDKMHDTCFDAGVDEGKRLGLAGLLKEDGDLGEWMVNTCAKETALNAPACFCEHHKRQAIRQLSRNLLRVETVVQWMKELLSHRLAHDSLSNRAGSPCRVASSFRSRPAPPPPSRAAPPPTTAPLPPKKRRPIAPSTKPTVEKRKKVDDAVVDTVKKPVVAKKSKPPPPELPTFLVDANALDLSEVAAANDGTVVTEVEISSQVMDEADFAATPAPDDSAQNN